MTNRGYLMQPFVQPSPGKRIGVISDTHGLLRPEALEALEGPYQRNWLVAGNTGPLPSPA